MGARVCPFCNFEQEMARAQDAERATISLTNVSPTTPPSIAPPSRPWWSTRVFVFTAAILLLASAFAVGALVNVIGGGGWANENESNDLPAETDKSKNKATAGTDPSLGDLRLVPADDPSVIGGQIITSAPVADPDEQLPSEYQRSDATALPSEQYARILKTTKPSASPLGTVVDPRSVSGGLMEQARRAEERRRREAKQSVVEETQPNQEETGTKEIARRTNPEPETRTTENERRTNPVPVYQPLPRMDQIRRDGTFRFVLGVGRDGLVKEVRVIESIPGMTPRMIAAVQRWKFKPATRNGEPVDGTFEVDISMKATE